MSLRAAWLVVLWVFLSGCDKGDGPKTQDTEASLSSCLIFADDGKPLQCFERKQTKAAGQATCSEMEGRTEFRQGPCPTEGSVGRCTKRLLDTERTEVCYRAAESCQKRCGPEGRFSKN